MNPGFDTQVLTTGTFITNTAPNNLTTGWQVVGPSYTLLIESSYNEPGNGVIGFTAQSGRNSVDLTDGNGATPAGSGVKQQIATTPGQVYDVSFYLGKVISPNGSPFYSGLPSVSLAINGAVTNTFMHSGSTTPAGSINWQQFTTSFTASTSLTDIAFLNAVSSNDNNFTGLDTVSVTAASSTAAPEPGSLALLALGMVGGAAARRRSRRRSLTIGGSGESGAGRA